MTKAITPRKSARDRILDTASKLFYQEGVHSVGIDRIIAESGVAKMSLYNHFKSKDALIEEWLRQRDRDWQERFQTAVERSSSDPRERLLAIFDVLRKWFEEPEFRGCAFINTAAELANPEHPGDRVAVEHQQAVYRYILSLVQAVGVTSPEAFARQILVLVEGAIVVAMMERKSDVAMQARQAATALLAIHLG